MLVQSIARRVPAALCISLLFQIANSSTADETAPPLPYISAGFEVEAPQFLEPVLEVEAATTRQLASIPAQPVAYSSGAASIQSCEPACKTCQPACTCCDCKTKAELNKRAAASHKPLFYLNDFSYLNDPCYDGSLLGDSLKSLPIIDGLTLDFGGQCRSRFHSEHNMRGLGLTGNSDDFLLHRTRMYVNAKLGSNIRFFGEMLDANSNYENDTPRPIEENRWDAQNLFIDVTLLDGDTGKLVARGGRQEIALGDQRYVSPLDWANTRRTFDGGRLMYTGSDWNVDGFWLAPMVRDTRGFDDANEEVSLYGIYTTYKGSENETLDLYWLAYDDDAAGFGYDSLGARFNGKLGELLLDTEGAYQFGRNVDDSSHDAGFFTVGLGKALAGVCYKPTTWLYFDWASGDDQQASGNGHHHFEPLAHKYNGFMDLFGRRNLMDLNWLTTMQLSEKAKLLTWYHSFWLEDINDTPYSVVMTPFAPGVAPGASHLGQELDIILSFDLSPRSDILFGYSHFWTGNYYDTPDLPTRDDADFFYTQYSVNF